MAYSKQTWTNGEVITDTKLNHMEDGIANSWTRVIRMELAVTQQGGTQKSCTFANARELVTLLETNIENNVNTAILLTVVYNNDETAATFLLYPTASSYDGLTQYNEINIHGGNIFRSFGEATVDINIDGDTYTFQDYNIGDDGTARWVQGRLN